MLLDRLFYKGMLITKFIWANIPVVIINTHILANFIGDWERHGMYALAEEKQLTQLANTVQNQCTDSLVIVVGDFNIPRGSKLYFDFLASSGLTDHMAADSRRTLRTPVQVSSQYPLAIDYVLVRMPTTNSFKVDCDLCLTSKYWINNHRQGYISDHNGIAIHLRIN